MSLTILGVVKLASMAASAFGSKSMPMSQGTVKEAIGNKTTGWGVAVIAFVIYQLTVDPDNHFYQFTLIFTVFLLTIRGTVGKLIVLLQQLNKAK